MAKTISAEFVIAIANDLPLYTCNPDDFVGIESLDVVAVAHPDGPPSRA